MALIVPIAEEHLEGFREALDSVARERAYLALLEAPPLAEMRKFVLRTITRRAPQFVALADATLQAAKASGISRVELTVRVDNEPAKRLYESFGFEVEGKCRRHMRVAGEYKDSYLMALVYG